MDKEQTMEESTVSRDSVIIRTCVIGILTNAFLAAFKAVVGIVSHSIAVTLDAVNNLSDALSSIITIVGTKLAGKKQKKKHPLGHGRVEYLSAMIVSGIVLYAGITSAMESVKKIIHPEAAEYSTVSLIIIAVAIAVKLILGKYVKKQGEMVNSGSLVASGSDATFDAILSASVLASAIIFLTTGISLEAWVGVVIAVFIIRSGIEMMTETLDDILGKRADSDVTVRIKRILSEEPEVRGAYDLFLYNYGPDRDYGSVHIELPDTMTVEEVDRLTRRLEAKVYDQTGVVLTGIGVYSYNTSGEAVKLRSEVTKRVMAHDWALQIHGFYFDMESREVRFDVVMSFDIDHGEGVKILTEEMQEVFPDYHFIVVPDIDISD